MPNVIKTVLCPTCQSQAYVRQRKGKYKQLDLQCPQCGVLNYQTTQGQAFLTGLPDIEKPAAQESAKPDSCPEYTGKSSTTFFD
ncbi:hypothetical protein JCM19239_5816 [Vibrio variabilis]|uniref:Uncharacterized protein n=1 Tax=Vibrio variabilis TaxID=990271 RepID=A0ABQ0J899_9VIBR|nr:hypothetical protein JCM19239_5816 [Vibrio variabilis]